jgi:RNA polymerase sigma-70 factor (ECF subfamily)
MAEATETALVGRCQQGDHEAFGELIERYQALVFGLLARSVQDRATAEDLAQEAFLRIHRGLPYFRGDARLGTWIYRIVANIVAEYHARRRHGDTSLDETYQNGEPRFDPGMVDAAFSDIELRDALEKGIAALPPQYRLVVAGYYLKGLKYEELADALGVPLGTIKTHLHRAKRLLRHHLQSTARSRNS